MNWLQHIFDVLSALVTSDYGESKRSKEGAILTKFFCLVKTLQAVPDSSNVEQSQILQAWKQLPKGILSWAAPATAEAGALPNVSDLSFVWRHRAGALTNYRWVILRCHGESAQGLRSKGLARAHRNIEQLTTTSYCARASGNPSQDGIFYSIFKSSQFFIEEGKLEQALICNQSARPHRKAPRKSSCSLVLYLLWELPEIVFLNGIESEGEGKAQPGQSSTKSHRPLSCSKYPVGTNPRGSIPNNISPVRMFQT